VGAGKALEDTEDARRSAGEAILADFALEFEGLARTVIESAVETEREHINTARRLFGVYSEALRSRADLGGRLDAVASGIGWSITVAHSSDDTVVAEGRGVETDSAPIVVPVPGRIPIEVRVRPGHRRLLDDSLVHYLAGLISIELEHQAQALEERQRRGGAVLRGALDGTVSSAQLRYELAARGMDDRPLIVAVAAESDTSRRPAAPAPPGVLGRGHDVAQLIASVGNDLVALVPADRPTLDRFRREVVPHAHVGARAEIAPGADLREAHLEARIAAAQARETARHVVFYDELDDLGGVGPRSLSDMRRLVDRVLGPLLEYDRSSTSDLVASLELFLRNDRSWARTAEELEVHRQTLIYSLGQVERLTGFKPTSTVGTATLWTVLQAAHKTGVLPPYTTHTTG
jgi:purine catabolism regulator